MERRERVLMQARESKYARCLLAVLLSVGLGLTACGDDDNAAGERISPGNNGADAGDVSDEDTTEEDTRPPESVGPPVSIETEVRSTTVTAGTAFDVTCILQDAEGNTVEWEDSMSPNLIYSPQDSFTKEDTLRLLPRIAGTASLRCESPDLSLIDETPVELTIEPGPAHTVVTELPRNSMVAGSSVEASCTVYDAYGNLVEGETPTVETSPSGGGVTVEDNTVTIETADVYTVSCSVDGAQEEQGADIEVVPGLPADLTIAKVPSQPVYDTGQVVTIESIVTDEYGNAIPWAPVDVTTTPTTQPTNATAFGDDRFKFDVEDTYDVTATVTGQTLDDQTLEETTQVIVNGEGPAISCKYPANNSMIGGASNPVLGSTVTFEGSVSDTHGIDEVRVNTQVVSVDQNGNFSLDIPVRFGINFVDIQARDAITGEWQQENSTTCAFLASDKYHPEGDFLNDGVSLRMKQEAVDDGNWSSTDLTEQTDSLNDLLLTAMHSDGISDAIDDALTNPDGSGKLLDDGTCREIYYSGNRIDGPHESSLTLLQDGLRLNAKVRNLHIFVYVDIPWYCTGLDQDVDVWVTEVDAAVDFDLNLDSNDKPNISVRSGTVSVQSGEVNLDSGLPDFLDGWISSLFQGTLQGVVEDTISDFLKSELNDLLDGVVGSLDVSSLGSTFDVPQFDSNQPLPINFGVKFSELLVNPTRALFGLGVKLTPGSTGNATPSKGVAMPTGPVLLDTTSNRPLTVAIHVGILNQALHALWRGGLFDADVASAMGGGGFPDGTTATMSTALPPVATVKGSDKAIIYLGGITLDLTYPGIFDEPVAFKLGGVAETGITLTNGDELNFQNISITELYFSPEGISLDADSRAVLEDFLRNLLQGVLDDSLNNALPALPIPSFTLPNSVGQYGLPAGRSLGLRNPTLGGTTTHLILKSAFGLLP
ncbi:MAG: hypothetical protein ACQEVA_11095 [Myxococcota bacterium]